MKSTKKFTENRFFGTLSPSSIRNLLPGSISAKHKLNGNPKSLDFNNENAPPLDPNISRGNKSEKFTEKPLSMSTISESKFNGKNAPSIDADVQLLDNSQKSEQNSFSKSPNPDAKDCSETLSNVRFGESGKSINNEPVAKETISEQNGDNLGDQIHQLKEELIRSKSGTQNSTESRNKYLTGKNARESLNELRVSLNRSLAMPCIYDSADEEEVNIGVDDVKELHQDLNKWHSYDEKKYQPGSRGSIHSSFASASCDADLMSEDEIRSEEGEIEGTDSRKSEKEHHEGGATLSITPLCQSPVLEGPTLSESPKISNTRKSTLGSTTFFPGKDSISESSKQEALQPTERIKSSLRSSKLHPDPTESLAASLQRGLQIIDYHQRSQAPNRSSVSFSFEHLTVKSCAEAEVNTPVRMLQDRKSQADVPSSFILCPSCQEKLDSYSSAKGEEVNVEDAGDREKELKIVCMNQAAKIQQLTCLLEQCKHREEEKISLEDSNRGGKCPTDGDKIEKDFDPSDKTQLLEEIADLKRNLQSLPAASRASLLPQSIQLRKSKDSRNKNEDELEKERQKWTEAESEWILLTDELRVNIEAQRRRAEEVEMELKSEKASAEELDDALHRAVLGHARLIEQYTELQEKYQALAGEHRAVMEGVAEVKRAVAKAKGKGRGARFAKALDAELSTARAERERERELLKNENKSLKAQLRDTAEAVQAAGELLVRLREAEEAASNAEENLSAVEEENEKLKKQIEKLKSKHKTEIAAMKHCLAESKLPSCALQPYYRDDADAGGYHTSNLSYDDQAWRAEFGAIYQEHL